MRYDERKKNLNKQQLTKSFDGLAAQGACNMVSSPLQMWILWKLASGVPKGPLLEVSGFALKKVVRLFNASLFCRSTSNSARPRELFIYYFYFLSICRIHYHIIMYLCCKIVDGI